MVSTQRAGGVQGTAGGGGQAWGQTTEKQPSDRAMTMGMTMEMAWRWPQVGDKVPLHRERGGGEGEENTATR